MPVPKASNQTNNITAAVYRVLRWLKKDFISVKDWKCRSLYKYEVDIRNYIFPLIEIRQPFNQTVRFTVRRCQAKKADRDGRQLFSHGVTSLGAVLACFSASFTVLHRVLRALGTAGLARFGAQRTYRLHVFAAPRDGRSGKAANVCTFQI